MTVTAIKAAVKKAVENNEDIQLWQSIEWLNDYHLIEYKDYKRFQEEMQNANKMKYGE